jgi:protein SCO1/2
MHERVIKPNAGRRLLLTGGVLAVAGLWYARRALAHDEHHHHEMAMAAPSELKRSEAFYDVPAARLVRQDGTEVAFPQELDDGRPVVLDFIYTSCTTICPVSSMVFSQLQDMIGKDVKMVSITIDPEYDTPQRLQAYATRFGAKPQWQHYTGSRDAILAVEKAFNVYRGDKMNHFAVTFLRAAPKQPWLRVEGFATPEDLAREYRRLAGAS